MKKKLVRPVDLCDFIERYNPLLLRDDKDKFEIFPSYVDCYYDSLRRIYVEYAYNYFDPVLYLVEHYGYTLNEAKTEYAVFRKLYRLPAEPIAIEQYNSEYYKRLMNGFHRGISSLSECPFKEDLFNIAFEKFVTKFNLKNEKYERRNLKED